MGDIRNSKLIRSGGYGTRCKLLKALFYLCLSSGKVKSEKQSELEKCKECKETLSYLARGQASEESLGASRSAFQFLAVNTVLFSDVLSGIQRRFLANLTAALLVLFTAHLFVIPATDPGDLCSNVDLTRSNRINIIQWDP